MNISNRRIGIATLMSDLNIMKKVPLGRLDELAAMTMPEEIERAIEERTQGRLLEKNSKLWRQVHHFFMKLKPLGSRRPMLTVGEQMEKERKQGESKAKRGPAGYFNGQVFFKKYVINRLIDAGKELYKESGEDARGCEPDLAESVLSNYINKQDFSPKAWSAIKECATDYVGEGLEKIAARHERKKAS